MILKNVDRRLLALMNVRAVASVPVDAVHGTGHSFALMILITPIFNV
jgi:hypothetical protein